MKKLKTILLFSLYFALIIYLIIFIKNDISLSHYKNESEIIGIINDYDVNDNYIKISLLAKEEIICFYYDTDINIKIGQTISVHGELVEPSKNTNFNLFNYKNYLLGKKIF